MMQCDFPTISPLKNNSLAAHSSIAWKIPWMEEPGGLQSMGSLSRTWLSNFTFTFHFHALQKEMATHSSVLAWRIPGTGEPGGLPSVGPHRVGHNWSDLAAAVAACPLRWWCHPTISSSAAPFSSCPQSFPASASFPVSWLFTSGGQNVGASTSASVLPANIQDWFPLGLTDLISFQSKGLSRIFSSTTIWKHQFVDYY